MTKFDAVADAEPRNQWNTLRTLAKYLWPRDRRDLKARVVFAMSNLALAKLATVCIPFLLKLTIDSLNQENTNLVTLPIWLIVGYGAARLLAQGFGELRDFLFAKVAQHAQRVIARSTFHHLHRLSLAFHLERQTGGLSRVIERGTHGIQFLLRFMLFNILPTLLEISLVAGILFYNFEPHFALIILLVIVGYIGYTLGITEWRIKYRRQQNQKDSEASNKAVDSLLNFETVKYFGNEAHEEKRFDAALAGYEKASVKSQGTLSVLNIGQGTIIGVGLVLVMVLAGKGVTSGTMTIGDFVMVNTYLMQLYQPLNFLGFVYREIKQSLTDMDKMFELLEVETDVVDRPGARPLKLKNHTVEFSGVNFSYNPERKILHDLSFKVPHGKKVAVVGPSGAGKSTISRLMFRFYDINGGAIKIDGQDIRDITQASLRAAIGIVPQDTVLFNDSIYYNILYGNPSATRKQVEDAAKLAQIHLFIMSLPNGYETVVGERGLKLSGGEKQRVAIARTILKEPQIFLFDEATSALDSHTEKAIQASLERVSHHRTTLVIAHRLSTVVDAEEILVLVDGHVSERGNHDQLLARRGEYARMWEKQQEEAASTRDTSSVVAHA